MRKFNLKLWLITILVIVGIVSCYRYKTDISKKTSAVARGTFSVINPNYTYLARINGSATNLSSHNITVTGQIRFKSELSNFLVGQTTLASILDDKVNAVNTNLLHQLTIEGESRLVGDDAGTNHVLSVASDLAGMISSISNGLSEAISGEIVARVAQDTTITNLMSLTIKQEEARRTAGDLASSNHVHLVETALSNRLDSSNSNISFNSNRLDYVAQNVFTLSNRLDSVESALTGTSNGLASAISAETDSRIAGDATNHNEIVGVQEYAKSVSNRFDSAVYVLATNLHTKVSTNHFGDVTIHGGIVVTDNIYMGEGKTLVLTNESDPYWSSVSNEVTQNSVKGSTAYGWGDHATIGYLTTEIDPSWSAVSNAVTQNARQGATAYDWGDHSIVGYLTDELDPSWSSVSNTVTQNAVQGAMAYGWGDHELAGYANTNGSIYVGGNVTATSFIGDGSQLSGIQVGDKVSTNHVGDVTITGDVSATSFIGDGSQLSGVSGGVEFPELVVGSSPTTTTIPFTKDYKYYKVVATNTTDIVFDYSGIGDFAGSALEFQLRVLLVSPSTTAVAIPAEGAGLKYVGDVDISATVDNTVQHLGMLMYSTNNVLMSHWYYEEP